MNILVIGHSYVVDSNRQFWNQVALNPDLKVDLIVPKKWTSNLIQSLEFKYNEKTDSHLNNIFAIDCYKKGNASLFFFNWRAMYKIFSSEKYDLIFVAQETWALSVAQVSLLKIISFNQKSLFYLSVCQNIIKKKLFWVVPWEKLLTASVDRILYCTKEIVAVLEWKKISSKNSYFPFTYDQDIYEFKRKKIKHEFTVGYMGRLIEEKGIECLIQACQKLVNEGMSIRLMLAGNGPLRGANSASFISYVGPFKHTEAHLFYHEIDLFVLPSETRSFWKEQFGRVLVESVASGTPVIGSSSGAIPEVLQTMELNYVFQEGNVENLNQKIKDIIADMKSDKFESKLIRANELNYKNFSHKKVGEKLITTVDNDLLNLR